MDHYQILGINRTATKHQVKQAFQKLAFQFHPDKHTGSSNAVKDDAILRFKQVNEAYQILIDDRKRAQYDFGYGSGQRPQSGYSSASSSGYRNPYGYDPGYNEYRYTDASADRFRIFRFLTSRAFLINAVVMSGLLGTTYVFAKGRDKLWQMHNSGKSFEEAIETIKKANAQRDKS